MQTSKPPKASKDPQYEEAARQGIIDVTRSLIEKYGYAKLSLTDIANELGKTKGFLYYYFPDKESIFLATVEAEMKESQERMAAALAKEASGLDLIRAYLTFSHGELKRKLPLILKLREATQLNSGGSMNALFGRIRELARMNTPMLEEFLRQGCSDGTLKIGSESELKAIARLIVLALQGIVYDYMLGDAQRDFEEELRAILKIIEHGIT